MKKKAVGKLLVSKSRDVSLETVHGVKQFAKVVFVKAMEKSSTTSDTTGEVVSIMFRFVSLVVTQIGSGNPNVPN